MAVTVGERREQREAASRPEALQFQSWRDERQEPFRVYQIIRIDDIGDVAAEPDERQPLAQRANETAVSDGVDGAAGGAGPGVSPRGHAAVWSVRAGAAQDALRDQH